MTEHDRFVLMILKRILETMSSPPAMIGSEEAVVKAWRRGKMDVFASIVSHSDLPQEVRDVLGEVFIHLN